jgi:hypothetical protein
VYWWPVFIVGTCLVVIALLATYTPYDLYPQDEQDNRPPRINRGQHTQIGRLQAFMLARLGSAFFAARFFSPVRVSKT